METRTFIGRKPDSVGVEPDGEGGFRLKDGGGMSNNIELSTPIMFGGMSYGSVSLNVHKSLAMAASRLGITMNTGEGGLHADLYPYQDNIIVPVSYTHLRAHETRHDLVCRLLLEKKKKKH